MPKDSHSAETRIESITKVRNEGGRFVVRWVELTPSNRAKSSTDRGLIEQFARDLQATARKQKSSKIKLPALDADDFGSAKFFQGAFGAAAAAATVAASAGDEQALVVISAYAKILSDLARGWQHYDQSMQVEQELEKLVKFHESTRKMAAREDSSGVQPDTGIADTMAGGGDEFFDDDEV